MENEHVSWKTWTFALSPWVFCNAPWTYGNWWNVLLFYCCVNVGCILQLEKS